MAVHTVSARSHEYTVSGIMTESCPDDDGRTWYSAELSSIKLGGREVITLVSPELLEELSELFCEQQVAELNLEDDAYDFSDNEEHEDE